MIAGVFLCWAAHPEEKYDEDVDHDRTRSAAGRWRRRSEFAETATNTPPTNNGQTLLSEPGMTLRQQVQNDLAKAGYTDIRVMPESFLVRAKDPKGNAVMMLINPDSRPR